MTTSFFFGTGAPTVISNGLVGYWKFDEASGTSFADSSGNGRTGTLGAGTNYTWSIGGGRVGNAIEFGGTTGWGAVTDHTSLQDLPNITLSAWIYPIGWGAGGFGRILAKRWEFYIGSATTQRIIWRSIRDTTSGSWNTPDFTIVLNTWQHVAVTYNNSSNTNDPIMYINGTSRTLNESGTPVGIVQTDVGRDLDFGTNYDVTRGFNGRIDEVRVYNRILSGTEISQIYNFTG